MVREAVRALLLMSLVLYCEAAFAAPAKWNFIVYLAADNNLESNADSDLEEMAKVGSTSDVNILVQVKRPRLSAHPGTMRYRLESGKPYGASSDIINGNPDSADVRTLREFIDWSYDNYPAERTAIIVWSHGQGWRAAKSASIANNLSSKHYKSIIQDDAHGSTLYQSDIEGELKRLKGQGRVLNLIGFDACLMSMLEVWSGLSDLADVGVASEDLEPGFGWDYSAVLEELTNTPTMSAKELGVLIGKTYAAFISTSSSAAIREEKYTITVIDLSKVADLTSHFDRWIGALKDSDYGPLLWVAAGIKPFAYKPEEFWPNGVDLGTLMQRFSKVATSRLARAAALSVVETARNAVLLNRNSVDQVGFPTGISIYFPSSEDVIERDPEGDAYRRGATPPPPTFVQTSEWPNLLRRLLAAKAKIGLVAPDPNAPLSDVVEVGDRRGTKFEICTDRGIDEDIAYRRFDDLIEEGLLGQLDTLDVTIALMAVVDDYCQNTTSSALSVESVGPWLALVRQARIPPLLLYATIRYVCENDAYSPSHSDFILKFINAVADADPDLLSSLESMFQPEVISEASLGQFGKLSDLLPSYGATSLFFTVYDTIADRNSATNLSQWTVSKFFVAQAYMNLVVPDLKKSLNARLEFGKDVKADNPISDDAAPKFKKICEEIVTRTANVSLGTPAGQMVETCRYYSALVAFLLGRPEDAIDDVGNWDPERDETASTSRSELRKWQMEWFRAEGLYHRGDAAASMQAFSRAFDRLLLADVPAIDRLAALGGYQQFAPDAGIVGDEGEPENSAYLFFCQWMEAAEGAGDAIEMLRVVERSKLFGGETSIVTGVFGGETQLIATPGVSEKAAGDSADQNAKLRKARGRLSLAIAANSFGSVAPNTLVYFENAWTGRVSILYRNQNRWLIRSAYFSALEAMDDNHSGRMPEVKYAYARYLAPIWSDLQGNVDGSRLYVVPDGFSRNLPFSAMLTGDGRYVVDKFAVVYLPSLVQLNTAKGVVAKQAKMLMVHSVRPTKDGPFNSPLFDGAKEGAFIRQALGNAGQLTELTGADATREKVVQLRTSNFDIFHVVSHSFALASAPAESGLVMTSADGQSEDILTLRDLQDWPHLQLITLAGCDTGTVRSEGAFLDDAPSLLTLGVTDWLQMSLWRLQDDAGSLMSKEFYSQLFSGVEVPEALRRAQLVAREAYPSPDQWGSVAIYGDSQD
ncbi:clostripain-related cysteine peptidase [Mesorhizobium sp. LNJC391B00]|uniref:clostripain-related cysteine peptidase n=1 Tax=Mesorhizobium sp. LNJC391B00 TaxID=1287273 RepID=UPI0018DB7786|nr:clostripain-related cysteine peptidase [Mesorhizobium sp. LNJC391B00]